MNMKIFKKKHIACIISIFCICFHSFSEATTWYRNDISSMAALTIADSSFHIIAGYNGHNGEVSGALKQINDTIYFAYVEDTEYEQKSLFVFEMSESNIQVTVYGDQIGAGAFVYYDGIYENKELTEEEYQDKYLFRVFDNKYDINRIKKLLKNDLSYFVDCFKRVNTYIESDENVVYCIEGYHPGDSDSQKGIILITKQAIEILFLDSRDDTWIYQYYTNKTISNKINSILLQWITDNGKYEIITHND
jgi:hypothetical protein